MTACVSLVTKELQPLLVRVRLPSPATRAGPERLFGGTHRGRRAGAMRERKSRSEALLEYMHKNAREKRIAPPTRYLLDRLPDAFLGIQAAWHNLEKYVLIPPRG